MFWKTWTDLVETLFGKRCFPIFQIYTLIQGKVSFQSLLLNAETLNRFPCLKMIHITGDLDVELTSDVFEQVHPLEVVFQKDSLVTYFALIRPLREPLVHS